MEMARQRQASLMRNPPKPRLKVRECPEHWMWWAFLDYATDYGGKYEAWDKRWFIEIRKDLEGFGLVCAFPFTFIGTQGNIEMISNEMALVPAAVAEIRRILHDRRSNDGNPDIN